jgi:hypothetical protein
MAVKKTEEVPLTKGQQEVLDYIKSHCQKYFYFKPVIYTIGGKEFYL